MDAPTCRLCQKKHWPREGCKFDGSHATVETQRIAPEPCRMCAPKNAEIARLQAENDELRKQAVSKLAPVSAIPANKTNRNEYQREYMRKRRANQKAA